MAQSQSQSQSNQISIEKYRDKAAGYDASAEFTMPLRRRTVALLQLQPGQTVLDVGAGTGLSYPLLRDGVGPTGRVLAFEQCPEMFEVARLRVQREGWTDVWHINQAAETVVLPQPADAVLFNYTHDICRTLWQPWSLVAEYCDDFRWSGTQWGMGYIASGTRKADPQR